MPSADHRVVLVVALAGINYATRPRKAARELAKTHRVRYLALQSSGRGGRVDRAGTFDAGGVVAHHVPVRPRRPGGRPLDKIYNMAICYAPAFMSLLWAMLRTRAAVVYLANPVLAPLAWLHRLRYRSKVVLDVAERPGIVAAGDSLASLASKLEPWLIRSLAGPSSIAAVAVPADAGLLSAWGFTRVFGLRNVPLESWRAPYVSPAPSSTLRCVVIGSVFEGRAYELMIEAMALAAGRGADVHLTIAGPGRESYFEALKQLVELRGITNKVSWLDAIEPDEVSALYLRFDLGFVLYEGHDPGNDGLSNKIMECVSTGRPVLAGDLPENRKFVAANGVGWLTEVAADAIAASLVAIASRADLAEVSRHCRDVGDAQLTWEREFAPVLAALNSVVVNS